MNTHIVYAGQFPGSPPDGVQVSTLWVMISEESGWRFAFFDHGVLCWAGDDPDWYSNSQEVDMQELADYEALWMECPCWGELVRSVGGSHEQ